MGDGITEEMGSKESTLMYAIDESLRPTSEANITVLFN